MTDNISSQHNPPKRPTIQPGKYQHYKGQFYQVLGVALHSEDESALVVYKPLYGEGGYWVRPYEMFVETVEKDGEVKPRFAFVGSDEN